MSGIRFDFNNAMATMVGHGFSEKEMDSPLLSKAYERMNSKHMGFRKLPTSQEAVVDDIVKTAQGIRKNYTCFVVMGIGGSALGPIAVYQALAQENDMEFVVLDNVDPETMKRTFDKLDTAKTMFNVITKSGKTSETMAQLMVAADIIKKSGLKLKDHLIATTDEKNGNLALIAKKRGS